MARIAGIDLPNKHVDIALTTIYGIGRSSAAKICTQAGIDSNRRVHDLSSEEINVLRKIIESDFKVEGRLRTEVSLNLSLIHI